MAFKKRWLRTIQSRVWRNRVFVTAILLGLLAFILVLYYSNSLTRDSSAQTGTFPAQIVVSRSDDNTAVNRDLWGWNANGYAGWGNLAAWQNYFNANLLTGIGPTIVRFPGGCPGDMYNWKAGKYQWQVSLFDRSGNAGEKDFLTVDEMVAISEGLNSKIIFHINAETKGLANPCGDVTAYKGTVQDAVDLVKKYGTRIAYYQLGNEPWGQWNGDEYAQTALQFARAMKQENPAIKIIIVGYPFTGNNPREVISDPNSYHPFTRAVRGVIDSDCSGKPCFDLVSVHIYPITSYIDPASYFTNGRYRVMQESYIAKDNKTLYTRACPMPLTRNPELEVCGPFATSDLSNMRGTGNERYRELGVFSFPTGSTYKTRYTFLDADGSRFWWRICTDGTNCSAWQERRITISGTSTFSAYDAYVEQVNGKTRLTEAVFSQDGKTGYYRYCDLGADGSITDAACGNGWMTVNIANSTGAGNEQYTAQATMNYLRGTEYQLQQYLLEPSGTKAIKRLCSGSAETGVDYSACQPWTAASFDSIRGLGNESYSGYSAYTDFAATSTNTFSPKNLPGAGVYFTYANLKKMLQDTSAAYNNKKIALTEWNERCFDAGGRLSTAGTMRVEQGLFVLSSLLMMQETDAVALSTIHDLAVSKCGPFANKNTLSPQGQVITFARPFAEGILLNSNVAVSSITVPSFMDSVTNGYLRGGATVPYVTSATTLRQDGSLMMLAMNTHPSQSSTVTVRFASAQLLKEGSPVTGRLLSSSYFTSTAFSESNLPVTSGQDSVTFTLPPVSVGRIAFSNAALSGTPGPSATGGPTANPSISISPSPTAPVSITASVAPSASPLHGSPTPSPGPGTPTVTPVPSTTQSVSINPSQVKATLTTTPVPTATFTPTPTHSPVPTFTPSPTITPSPTPTPRLASVSLTMDIAFAGLPEDQVITKTELPAWIAVYNAADTKVAEELVTFKANPGKGEFEIRTWKGTLPIPSIAIEEQYRIRVKGTRHMSRIVCDTTPAETDEARYQCNSGGLRFQEGQNSIDATQIRLLAGDIPLNNGQDGVIDAVDTGKMLQAMQVRLPYNEDLDLNFDGKVDTQDYSLQIAALKRQKYDELLE